MTRKDIGRDNIMAYIFFRNIITGHNEGERKGFKMLLAFFITILIYVIIVNRQKFSKDEIWLGAILILGTYGVLFAIDVIGGIIGWW